MKIDFTKQNESEMKVRLLQMTKTESSLSLIKSEMFGEVQADFYKGEQQDNFLMTINQLAECLGFATKAGIGNIISRNEYLNNEEFSTTHKLCTVEGNRRVSRNIKLFTEDGIYEVTFLAKTEKAKEFRKWVRGILKQLRTGQMQLSNQGITLSSEVFEKKVQQLISDNMTTIDKKINIKMNDILNSLLSIQKLVERSNQQYTKSEWKTAIFEKIKLLIAEQPEKYSTTKEVLKEIYTKMRNVYGIVFDQELKEYNAKYNTTGRQSGIELVDNKESLKIIFNCLLIDMFKEQLDKPINKQFSKTEAIKETIKPLIEKYQDQSKGGNGTYRKVYKEMSVDWSNRQTRYKKMHNLKNTPSKFKLITVNDNLFKLFSKVVNEKLKETI